MKDEGRYGNEMREAIYAGKNILVTNRRKQIIDMSRVGELSGSDTNVIEGRDLQRVHQVTFGKEITRAYSQIQQCIIQNCVESLEPISLRTGAAAKTKHTHHT